MKLIQIQLLVLLTLGLAACAGSGAASNRTLYRESLGTNTPGNIVQYTEETLLTTYGFRYERAETDSPDNIFLRTDWKAETPTADEQALGIQFVRTRVTITARTSNRTTGDVRARFAGEAQYRMTGSAEWVDAAMTPQREDYFDEIVDYLERQLRSAWRE